jgi:hypothetical protein
VRTKPRVLRDRGARAGVRARNAQVLVGLVLLAAAACAVTVEPIHTFKGTHHGGVLPQGALLQASDGWLWGATSEGGDDDDGIVFRVSLDSTYESVTGVPLAIGRGFVGDLVEVPGIGLFAVTTSGGDYNAGSIVVVGFDGSSSLAYSFDPAGWGGHPTSGLTMASDGHLYGVIPRAGSAPAAIYRLEPVGRTWQIVATLPPEVANAGSRLVAGSDGALYGVSTGADGDVYRVTPRGIVHIIHAFSHDGEPQGLVAGTDGNLYGTIYPDRRPFGYCGSVFRMTLSGEIAIVRELPCPHGNDGPLLGIAQGADGSLHGTSRHRHTNGTYYYTAWSIAPDGSHYAETRMSARAGEGSNALIQASDGAYYATAPGGRHEEGTLVRITP